MDVDKSTGAFFEGQLKLLVARSEFWYAETFHLPFRRAQVGVVTDDVLRERIVKISLSKGKVRRCLPQAIPKSHSEGHCQLLNIESPPIMIRALRFFKLALP